MSELVTSAKETAPKLDESGSEQWIGERATLTGDKYRAMVWVIWGRARLTGYKYKE
jgi:hypothetical protein